jgi:hypothetical protein
MLRPCTYKQFHHRDLQLPMQSVYITTDAVNLISDYDEVNSKQHYVILCISDSSNNKAYRQDVDPTGMRSRPRRMTY